MKLLVDMNLSPDRCPFFSAQGWTAVHWSGVGAATVTDKEVMAYAVQEGYTVFSHDLDFSAILAASPASAPSVIQVRAQDTLSRDFQELFAVLCVGSRVSRNPARLSS